MTEASGAGPAGQNPAAAPPAPPPAPYPGSATPYPTSATPYPTSATPYPTSATPYPTSATPYPGSAMPYPGYPMAAVKPRLSAWIWVLAALSVVLLVLAGTLGLRYSSVRAANAQAITDREAQIEELHESLRRLADEREHLDEEQETVLAAIADIGVQIDEHEACPNAVLAFDDALGSGTEAEQSAAFEAMVAACHLTL